MANNCHGRKLSELLREQQEPFLVHRGGAPQCRSVAEVCWRRLRGLYDRTGGGGSVSEIGRRGGRTALGTTVVCGGKAVRMALRWDLAGCFSCGARERFRRLPRAGGDIGNEYDVATEFGDSERHLSPVSVLQLQSDELNHCKCPASFSLLLCIFSRDEEDDSKPSTSGSSTPPDHHGRGATTSSRFTFYSNSGGKVHAAEGEDDDKFQTKSGESLATTEQQAVVSAWERIAADISRIPATSFRIAADIPRLVELDLSRSAREWRWRIGEEEARWVGESIEAMIFEEVRWEAVRDMLLCLRAL
ncbi:hypothetical protein EJB05_00072, partial [Eragrostis curvula]